MRRGVSAAAVLLFAFLAMGRSHAQPTYPLYPTFDCWDPVSDTEVRLHFGVTNLTTTAV